MKSKFAEALRSLLDDTTFFDRKGWSEFLGITQAAIEQWLSDETIPRFDQLMVIYDFLYYRKVPLDDFEIVAQLNSREISPHGDCMLPTVWDYMHRSPYPNHPYPNQQKEFWQKHIPE